MLFDWFGRLSSAAEAIHAEQCKFAPSSAVCPNSGLQPATRRMSKQL